MQISAPGKLFLNGEWSVLEVGNPGIVSAVDKRMYVDIEENDKIAIDDKSYDIQITGKFEDGEVNWDREVSEDEKQKLLFVKASIETSLKYLEDYKPFKLTIEGKDTKINVNGETKKLGFGSSSAVVVSTIGAILSQHGYDISKRENKDLIYKLSAMTHYFGQGKLGSSYDIAASTYGGCFVYKRFDPDWLQEELNNKSLKEVMEEDWEGFYVDELEVPDDLVLSVGWTGESASTSKMVKQMHAWRDDGNQEEYDRLYGQISDLVNKIAENWKQGNKEELLNLIRKNEDYLRELGEKSGVNIETPELKTLAEIANKHGAAGKLSGAGGGDCGIAISFDKETAKKIEKDWEEAGLTPVGVGMARDGVEVEK